MQAQNDRHLSAEYNASDHSSLASTSAVNSGQRDLLFSSWEWPSSSSHFGNAFDSPIVVTHRALGYSSSLLPPALQSSSAKGLPLVDHGHEYLIGQRSPPSGSLLLPSPFAQASHSIQPNDTHLYKSRFPVLFGRPCVNEPSVSRTAEDEEDELSPLDWNSRHKNLLASPFSEDSDSDDGLAPSPFSSPESTSESEPEDEEIHHRPLYFSPPSSSACSEPRYHKLEGYPHRDLYHDQSDIDDLPLQAFSFPFSSSSSSSHLFPELDSHDAAYDHDLRLQSPSLHSTRSTLYDSLYSGNPSMTVPDSPHCRAMDLPPLEDEGDANSAFGLGLHSMGSPSSSTLLPSFSFDRYPHDEPPPPPGVSQRTTWLSFPGEDTDDDLIPSELASKNYIPDPALAIPTTPPSRNLLIWDPTTRSGLPAGLPSFDGTTRTARSSDADDSPLPRSPSPGDDFDVDPGLLAELAERDAEKGGEVQKLCELRERTTIAAAVAASRNNKDKEGAHREAEKVKEKWREVTALLRLKLKLEENSTNVVEDPEEISKQIANGADSHRQQSSSFTGDRSSSRSLSMASKRASVPDMNSASAIPTETLSNPTSLVPAPGLPTLTPSLSSPLRRTSKPKITSMDQLVATMVLHRQHDALRRSPARNRTWSPTSCVTSPTSLGSRNKTWVPTSPTSPLRQVILPEDLDDGEESNGNDSPLQLSPLCLVLRGSPESFYAQLEAPNAQPSTRAL